MVNVTDVVAVPENGSLPVEGKIIYPIWWFYCMLFQQVFVLTKKLDDLLADKKVSVRMFAEIVAELDNVGWLEGFPVWGYLDLATRKFYSIRPQQNGTMAFSFPQSKRVITLPYLSYKWGKDKAGGQIMVPTTASVNFEKDDNMTIMNCFIKGKFPMRLDSFMPSGRSIPVRKIIYDIEG